jgi:hypothetical protein
MVDDLNGRELDALVAQHVFGLQVEARTNARTGQKDFVYAVRPDAPKSTWVRVPFYTANAGATITVEVELQERGWERQAPRWNEPREGRVVLEHTDRRTVEALGPVNEALCRAALKAMVAAPDSSGQP